MNVHVHVCVSYITADEPQGTIIFNQFLLPLPRVSTRDVVAMKLWIPEYLNDDGSSGEPAMVYKYIAYVCTLILYLLSMYLYITPSLVLKARHVSGPAFCMHGSHTVGAGF